VYVRDVDGGPISQMALVTVTKMSNQYWKQMTAQAGRASFDNVASGRYTVQVVAPGYVKAVEDVDVLGSGGSELVYVTMKPESPVGEAAPVVAGPPVLAPKAQKELGKALEALRASKFAEARAHLDAVYRLAPSHPDVNFLFGVYSSLINDWQQAKSYWEKAIAIYPQHLLAQVSLGDALLRENKPADAIPHLKKALEFEPNSWRAHAPSSSATSALPESGPCWRGRSPRKGRPIAPSKFWNLIFENIPRILQRRCNWTPFVHARSSPLVLLLLPQLRRFP